MSRLAAAYHRHRLPILTSTRVAGERPETGLFAAADIRLLSPTTPAHRLVKRAIGGVPRSTWLIQDKQLRRGERLVGVVHAGAGGIAP